MLLTADFVVAAMALGAAAMLRFDFDIQAAHAGLGLVLPRAASFALWAMVGLASMGLYRHRQRPRPWETASRVIAGVLLGVLGNVLFFYIFPVLQTGRGVMMLATLIAIPALAAERYWLLRVVDFNPAKIRILVLGAGRVASRIAALRRRADRRRFEIVAYAAVSEDDRRLGRKLGLAPIIDLQLAVKSTEFDEIVVAQDDRRGKFPTELLLDQRFKGVRVLDIVDFLERETEKIDFDVMHPGWLIFASSDHAHPMFLAAKRLFDLVVSFSLLLIMTPVLLLIMLAIKIEDGLSAPVFYRQTRVGRHDRHFELLKFRSMGIDAESGTGPRWAMVDDDRVTRVGRFLRRFRLDEVPQIVNVIKGDMSIVGPRPERPEFVENLTNKVPYYNFRHCVRPGLTGWAQLNFPYGATVADARNKLKYDLYYIKNASLVLDTFVVLQTVEVVIWGKAISMAGPVSDVEPGVQLPGRLQPLASDNRDVA